MDFLLKNKKLQIWNLFIHLNSFLLEGGIIAKPASSEKMNENIPTFRKVHYFPANPRIVCRKLFMLHGYHHHNYINILE
jgi:hypothetical protein